MIGHLTKAMELLEELVDLVRQIRDELREANRVRS